MLREFEIFGKPAGPTLAVKRGFCWPGFFFVWLWAFARKLWVPGAVLLVLSLAIGVLQQTVLAGYPLLCVLLALVLGIPAGLRGNSWRARKLERDGYAYHGTVPARSAPAAVAAHVQGRPPAPAPRSPVFFAVPRWFQGSFAIVWLTWKAAFRFRLFLVLAVLLLTAVVGLPLLIKDDGTARGFTQILLTYTLSVITALLGLSTLWLACGTLARDVEDCQIQLVAVKPIARWQIWLGKWLGILSLNAALLALSGASVYGLLLWRATRLPPEQQRILHNEVLVARGGVREESMAAEIDRIAEALLQERLAQAPVTKAELPEVRRYIREQVLATNQVVQPGGWRLWQIQLGSRRHLRDEPLQLRIRFNAAGKSPSGTFLSLWQVGVPEKMVPWRSQMSLAPDTFHEFEIPPNLFDEQGVLTVIFINANDTALLFPLDEGMEVLYREGGFALNFVRGLGIIFCWMALLATLGLTAASFLSFPVAAFFSLGLLTMALSSGTLTNVVNEGTIMSYNQETGVRGWSALDAVVVPAFRGALAVINMAKGFSPIDALSTGRSISWGTLGIAVVRIILLLGGVIGAVGIFVFSRRELATAQGNP